LIGTEPQVAVGHQVGVLRLEWCGCFHSC
jgi:hypothetical protein